VLCKADLIDAERRTELSYRHPDAVLVSGLSGEGMESLIDRIEEEFARTLREVELLLPYGEGAKLAELHELAGDLEREDRAEGVRIRARLPASAAARYERFALSGERA
jgi:GTPase